MNDACDALIDRLEANGDIELVEVPTYDFDLFNACAERGEAVITSGALSGLHPMLKTLPLTDADPVPCSLLYPCEPASSVEAFIEAYRSVLEAKA